MTGQVFISLLNPGIGLLLAAAFFMLWFNQRQQTYVLIACVSYFLMMLGFVLQDVVPPLSYDFNRIPANLCFMLAAYSFAAAIFRRYREPVPHLLMAVIVVVAMTGEIWFLWIRPDVAIRIYFVSFSLGAIALLTVALLIRAEKPHFIDHLLFWVLCAAAANFIVRPLLIAWLVGLQGGPEDFQHSIYWTTVQFTQAMISITSALTLLVSVAIDLINELQRKANTDQLSGLLNRRGFEEEAAAALQSQAARGWPVALLIADIDNFKSINDTYGHVVGDKVIAMLGELLKQMSAAGVVAGRIGGEEFAILMTGIELGTARGFAERLRAELPGFGDGRLPLGLSPTLSVGVHVDHAWAGLYDMLSHADVALYEAKRSGRNCTTVFKSGLARVSEGVA